MRLYLHVILLTLFIISMQGCSSTEKKEEYLIETPQIETSGSQSNGLSEIVVHGKPGSVVYVNGKLAGTINQEGTAVIALEIPQGEADSIVTLVLKDEAGNKSEPVVFTLSAQPIQNSETNSSEEDNKQEDNNSTDNGDGNATQGSDDNISVDDDNASVTTPPVTTPNPTVATLKSLTLTADNTTLNKDTNTTVKVMATFSNNSTKEVTQQVTWSITPDNALSINNRNLKAVNDGNITLQATLGNKHSNILHVNVFWEIHGYRLPPMPDEKLNNATLLGIDSNNNGVRDDVERYLLNKYKDHHKIVSEIALQTGRAYQIVIEDPSKARETTKYMDAAQDCNYYFESSAKSYSDPILIDHLIMDYKFEDVQLNTKERVKAYLEYNHNLSGGVYRSVFGLKAKALCDFNTTELLRVQP